MASKRVLSALKIVALATTASLAIQVSAQQVSTGGGSAQALADAGRLDEVVVTARRRSEKIQNVPVAITALSIESLRADNIVKVSDLAQVAPGFAATASNRGANSPTYEIRGQRGPNTETLLNDPAVAVYFAEVNQSRTVGTNQTMYDLDSVQVLKGPQGTLFGRNSTGGAVLIEPKKPSNEFEGYGQVSLGDYNFHDFEGMINMPINEKVAVRAAGKVSERDGYLHSVVTGQDADDLDAQSIRLSVRLLPTDNIDSNFIASFFHGGGVGEANKLVYFDPRGVTTGLSVARPIWIADMQQQLATSLALPKYQTTDAVPQGMYDRGRSIQNNTTIDLRDHGLLGDLTVKNILGFKDILDRPNGLDNSGSAQTQYYYFDTKIQASQVSEELQLQGKTENLNWVAGVFYFSESGTDSFSTGQFSYFGSPQFQSQLLAAAGPATLAALDAFFPANSRTNLTVFNDSYAAFVHGDYKMPWLLEGLSLAGGVRVTNDDRQVVFHNQGMGGTNPKTFTCTGTGVVLTSIDPAHCALEGHIAYVVPTYDMSLDYQVNPDLLLYVTSRYGYRAGGFNNVPPFPNSLVGTSYGPEYDRDVELGAKYDFNAAGVIGRVNVALFHTWYTDVQESSGTIINNTIVGVVNNAASAHLDGGEVELTLKPTSDFEFDGSFAFIQPKFDKYTDNIKIGTTITPIDVSDARFPWVPYRQYSVSGLYHLPLPEEWGKAMVKLTYTGQSGISTNNPDTSNCGPVPPTATTLPSYPACLNYEGRLPGYGILKLRADWRNVANRGFDLAFFIDNVANEYYTPYSFTAIPNGLGTSSVNIGAPRMFGFEARIPFGAMSY